ncbi:MAG: aspartate carbamoyltransferase catalytic subunit [Acidimicrobiia bacterium]|nr:aspartate carbamoyltransferase catalytic subunit [Acidimicrobiia bacterium]MDQ3500456.1 aspartate carbamoyltransferase catalytic subunit [Actinomycetota bacterium]
MKHLLSISDLDRAEIEDLLTLAAEFSSVLERDIPKVPTLRGRTIATVFFEASTRTRLSFERAAKALSADVMSFAPGTSSVTKGESLKDTVLTLEATGADLFVVRHESVGAAARVAGWVNGPVINGGDGAHQHPTQALLDALTLRQRFGKLDGLKVGIVGDIANSRVARSNIDAFTKLGAQVELIAPSPLLPVDLSAFPVTVSGSLEDSLPHLDVVYLLRVQIERGSGPILPSLAEYGLRFGMNRQRLQMLPADAVVMHPGPINRGVEITADVADDPRSLVLDQVQNGVSTRMAVIFRLLGAS